MSKKEYIFLSYRSVEVDFAVRLAADLKNAGVNLWMDRLDIMPGDDWPKTLASAVNQCAAMIVIISPEYVGSKYCQRELARADRLRRPIFPVLLRPIPDTEWPIEIERSQQIDFSNWRDDKTYHQQLDRLVNILKAQFATQMSDVPDPETRYLNSLIADLEVNKGVLEYLELAIQTDQQADSSLMRPRPMFAQTWGAQGRFVVQAESRNLPLDSIYEAVERYPQFVLLGKAGMGKTMVLHHLALEAAQHRLSSPRVAPLPFILKLADWGDDSTPSEFIRARWPLDSDPIKLLAKGKIVLYLDGLNEMITSHKAKMLRDWLKGTNAPQRVVITCRAEDYAGDLVLSLPVVEAIELNADQIRAFVAHYVDEPEAESILKQLLPDEAVNQRYLYQMARNPFLLSALVIVYKGSPTADLPHNEGELLKRLIGNLWERYQRAVPNAQFEPVEAALTDLAFALTDGDMPVYVTLDYALEYMGERALLNTAVSAKLLETEGDNVRFSHHLIQEYFAALGLLRAGLPTHLTKPQFDRSIRRISRKWDSAMMMLTGIANNPDVIVTNIAEVDPYLALECIVNGASVSSNTHQQTIDRLLNTMRAEGDTRVAVARIMMAFDPQTALTILLEALRDGVWDVRLAAASAFADLNVPVLPGLTQALHDLNDDTREATANALRQLGKSALPTTLQLLRDPNWRVRRGAAWALSELRDKAAVTLLLNGLHADEHLVSAEAALALGRIKDPAAVPSLLDALRHENWRVRKAAAVALGRIGQPAIPGLLIALKDANPSLRRIAVDALGLIRDDSVRPALLDASHDEIAEVRSAAVEALRHFLDVSVAKRLSELLSDTARSRHSKQRICDIAASILETTGIDQDAVDQARKQPPNSKKINAATAGRERLLRDKEEFSAAINDYPDALTNADWVVRRDAVQSLAALDPVVAVPKLLKTLGDEDSQVRIAVVKMLATINNSAAVQGLLLALGDDDYLVCDAATEALKTVGKPPVPGLLDAIHSTNVNVRAAAITIAGHLRDTETTTSIIDCLSDVSKPWLSDQRICDMAATALEKVGTAEALDAVRQWRITFKVPPPSTSKPALTDIRPREILGELLDALHNSDWNRRQDAAKALRDYAKEMHGTQDATLLMRLTQALDDTDWIVRWAAAEALAWIGDKAAVPALVSLLSDKNRTVRVAVIRALLEIGDPSAAGSLMKMLHDKNEMVRETTAEALGHLGDISTVPGLTAALDDPEWFVRLAAAEALGKMQHSSAVQPLITALHDDNNHVRWAAANALARLANEAVVADLIASLEDTGGPYWEDKRVCDIVADALVGIGTSEAINAVDVWRRGQLK